MGVAHWEASLLMHVPCEALYVRVLKAEVAKYQVKKQSSTLKLMQ